jgi:hypothetical protein
MRGFEGFGQALELRIGNEVDGVWG